VLLVFALALVPLMAGCAVAQADGEATPAGAGSAAPGGAAPDRVPTTRSSATSATRIGQFVAKCPFSHRSSADPLVHPHRSPDHDAVPTGQHDDPALHSALHSHDFFGNTTTDEHSTIASLEALGSTTCDLVEDLSSYWTPTLFRGGAPVQPAEFAAYYDSAPGVDPATVQPLPLGLSMVAGNDPRPGSSGTAAGWVCGKNRTLVREGVPTCGLGAPLTLLVDFPDCWNGRDLDSTDHRSHVAYSALGRCPAAYPVPIVRLELSVRYPIYGDPAELSLASGNLDTAHADFMNAWTDRAMRELVDLCIYRRVICGIA